MLWDTRGSLKMSLGVGFAGVEQVGPWASAKPLQQLPFYLAVLSEPSTSKNVLKHSWMMTTITVIVAFVYRVPTMSDPALNIF